MDVVTEIENNFSGFTEVSFRLSFFKDDPHWVSLCIDDHKSIEKVVKGYYTLYDLFKNDKCRLIIYDHQYHNDISILNETTIEIINIKSLKFDFDEMDKFQKRVPKDYKFDLRVEYGGAMILDQRKPLLGLYMSIQKNN